MAASSRSELSERVTRTSTRVPGVTKPATPITSSTLTLTARIPSGITIGSPPPASLSASLAVMSGSLALTGVISPRPSTCSSLAA